MKLKGFSFAEVMITLVIIGVIAALTMPALNNNIQKSQAGPALLRAIATLDTAHALMMNEHDMYHFNCNNDYVTNCFERYIKDSIGAAHDTTSITYIPFSNTSGGSNKTIADRYVTKNGFSYTFEEGAANAPILVYIDTNGIKAPNIWGKDLFLANFSYAGEGKVFAAGAVTDPIRPGLWHTTCNSSTITVDSDCAGSIVDNGGKVIYPWK